MHQDQDKLTGAIRYQDQDKLGVIRYQPPPDQIHIERFDGGFVVNGWRNGEQVRAVAHNPTRLAKLVRSWSETEAPQPAEASE